MTTFYCLRFETPPTWRARFPYLYPPGTGWPSDTPRHWVPFSSPRTTRRATVEVFDPASTREASFKVLVRTSQKTHMYVAVTPSTAVTRQRNRDSHCLLECSKAVADQPNFSNTAWCLLPLVYCLANSSDLNMEAICLSEILGCLPTTRVHNSEDSTFHNHRRDSLKSKKGKKYDMLFGSRYVLINQLGTYTDYDVSPCTN
jgi:hypothetical protein